MVPVRVLYSRPAAGAGTENEITGLGQESGQQSGCVLAPAFLWELLALQTIALLLCCYT